MLLHVESGTLEIDEGWARHWEEGWSVRPCLLFFLFFPFSFSPAADVSDRLFSRGNNTLNHPFLLPLPVGIEKALEKRENMDSESKGSYSVADK